MNSERGTDWDGYSAAIAGRKQSPEWAVLRDAREQHYERFFRVEQGEALLDAGCGHGEYTAFALSRGARVWSVDRSHAMLRYTGESCAEAGLVPEGTSQQSVMALAFPDDYFDAIYCLSVLECISSPEQAMRELVRVLKPGGRLYLDVCNANAAHWHLLFLIMQTLGAAPKGDMRYFRPRQLRRMAEAAGCTTIGDCGQAFLPPFSGIYTADLRRYTVLPEWLIRPLDRLYLAVERAACHIWPLKLVCWHYFLELRKDRDRDGEVGHGERRARAG